MVRNLLRAQNDVLAVASSLVVHTLGRFRRQGEGGSRSDGHLTCVNQVNHAVLNNLGVGLDVLKLGVQQTRHHGVRNVTDARLHDVLVVSQATRANFALEEVEEMAGNSLRGLIQRLERGVAVRRVGLDNCDNLVQVDVDVRGTNAVTRGVDRHRRAVRQVLNAVDVVHALEFLGLPRVDLDDDLVSVVHPLDVVANA